MVNNLGYLYLYLYIYISVSISILISVSISILIYIYINGISILVGGDWNHGMDYDFPFSWEFHHPN